MRGFSKFFTPPFSKADRDAFFDCLGLSMLDFMFVEMSGSLVLRARQFVGAEAEALLLPVSLEANDPRMEHERLLIARHPNQLLEITPIHKATTLWEEVFPYPFNLIGAHFAGGQGPQLLFGRKVGKKSSSVCGRPSRNSKNGCPIPR